MSELYGGIEAGGTKFICVVGTSAENIIAKTEIPTTSPEETLEKVASFLKGQPPLKRVGVASFGPIDLDTGSRTYGNIMNTPKEGWRGTDITGLLTGALNTEVAIETDVNCAALGEQRFGAAKGLGTVSYMTVGTGIGIGSVVDGKVDRGLTHSEMGHMLIPRIDGDTKPSSCPFHDSCLEGLASGTALRERWGVAAETLDDESAWQQEAVYVASGLVNAILCRMPERIILGGGVMGHEALIDDVRKNVLELLNGYVSIDKLVKDIENYIVAPGLGKLSGATGALVLAGEA